MSIKVSFCPGLYPGSLRIYSVLTASLVTSARTHTQKRTAKVAVSRDSEAPIFEMADVGLVADAYTTLSELEQLLSAR